MGKNYHLSSGTYIEPCASYIPINERLCDMHRYLQRISCSMYHYMFDMKLQHVSKKIRATVELNARLQYEQRFSIECDGGHRKWNEHLRKLIENSYDEISHEEEERQRIDTIYNEIMYDRLNLHTLKSSKMSLEITSGPNYNDYGDDDNWSDGSEVKKEEVKCDKWLMNLYLFSNYFEKTRMCDLTNIDLIQYEKKKNYVDEMW